MQFNIIDLVYQSQQNDLSALSKLYCMTFKDTYYFALRFAGDETVAQELVTRIYKKAFEGIATLERPESFEAWLSFTTSGVCVDYMSEENLLDFGNVELPEDFEQIDENTEFLPQGVENAEKVNLAINKIIDTLPDNQRAAVMLYYFGGMSTQRMAGFIGCSEEDAVRELEAARFNIKAEMERMVNRKTALYPIEQVPVITMIMQDAKEQTAVASDVVKAIFSEITSAMPESVAEEVADAAEEPAEVAEEIVAPEEEIAVSEEFEEAEAEQDETPTNKPNGKRIALICVAATFILIAFIATMGLVVAELG
jgi:RNA polymerase sigma-70 factor (ECF subfamily)